MQKTHYMIRINDGCNPPFHFYVFSVEKFMRTQCFSFTVYKRYLFGQSHNNRLRFYRCKILLDGSDWFWYINQKTWGKYLFGPLGQMVTDAMVLGDNYT